MAQLIYLVMFSDDFFFKGFTGLATTIGSILTLFVVMQATGRIRWKDKFASAALWPNPQSQSPQAFALDMTPAPY